MYIWAKCPWNKFDEKAQCVAVLGIFTGIWDIVDGVNDINGSDHAKAYRDAGNQIKDNVDTFDVLLKSLKNWKYTKLHKII